MGSCFGDMMSMGINGADDGPLMIQVSRLIYFSKQSLYRWETEVQRFYPMSLAASSEARCSEQCLYSGTLERKEGGRQGSRKDGFRIYHLEVSIRNLHSLKRLLDQDSGWIQSNRKTPPLSSLRCPVKMVWPRKSYKIIHLRGSNLHVHLKNTHEIGQAIKGMLIWKATTLKMLADWQQSQ